MPIQDPAAPTPPTPPIPPVPPTPFTVIPDFAGFPGALGLVPGMPLTDGQREALLEARSEISNQLTSASGRRNDIAQELRNASGADRAGLEKRLGQLDDRIVQLEGDLAQVGRVLSSAPAEGSEQVFFAGTSSPAPLGGLENDQVTMLGVVFMLFVLAPMALAAARLMWRRAIHPRQAPPSADSSHRLERVEQAIDAVAVEVERISEGQRFVTRLLTEGPARIPLAAQRGPEAVGVPRRDASRTSRDEP